MKTAFQQFIHHMTLIPNWMSGLILRIGETFYNCWNLLNTVAFLFSLVTWIVSHCHTVNERENYVAEMRNFIPIKIYGKCNNNPLERTGYNDSLAIGKSTFFLNLSNARFMVIFFSPSKVLSFFWKLQLWRLCDREVISYFSLWN